MYDAIIIGCGIVGAATAFRLSRYRLKLLVLDKENDAAMGATRANSAIIHAGFDPEPGTLMARLNVLGNRLTPKLCKDLSVPFIQNGALVLAFDEADECTLETLYARGTENGVQGLELISGERARQLEPALSKEVTKALLAPTSGIVDPWEYALAQAETAALNGVEFRFGAEVRAIEKTEKGYRVKTPDASFETRFVINAAGVYSDRIHEMVSAKAFTVTPVRGDYCVLDKCESQKAGRTLFQCPSKLGKGVLVTSTVHGNLLVGPSAISVSDKDRVATTAQGIEHVKALASKSVPGIDYRNTIRQYAGLRANSDRSDFIIGFAREGFLDLAGIKSPGLTAAPAIAIEAETLLSCAGLELVPNPDAMLTRVKKRFHDMSHEERAEAVRKDPLMGRVICRCETVTEAEIIAAIHSPLPARTLDGVKRRANAGMGRCQGGFCSPRVVEILARELNLSPLRILKDAEGSYILSGTTKDGDKENEL